VFTFGRSPEETCSRITVNAPPERTYDPAGGSGTSTLVIDRHGEVFHFARNRVNDGTPEEPSCGELAGVGFSTDGKTMFFIIYDPGITFAVTGPWNRSHD
jgi:hypothetical protein